MAPGPGCLGSSPSSSISCLGDCGPGMPTLCFSSLICRMGRKSIHIFVSWPDTVGHSICVCLSGVLTGELCTLPQGWKEPKDGIQEA